MKKAITIPVTKSRYGTIEDPFGKFRSSFALVNVGDLPTDLPLDVNPRNQNTRSRVALDINATLQEEPEKFHLFNRGITINASEASYDAKRELLTLLFPNDHYGIIDGGHTYAVICENKQGTEQPKNLAEAFVRLEVLTGIRQTPLIVDLARARNTSAQVKDESLANLEGAFDWIKEALKDQPYALKIAYRENEDPDIKPIDIREIIALLTMYHPNFQESEQPPVLSYGSKGRCLDMFGDPNETIQHGYKNLRHILPDILCLFDYIHLRFEALYKKLGGYSGITGEQRSSVKLGKVTEVKHIRDGFPLYYLGQSAEFRFPSGWVYPVLASLRGLVRYKGVYSWRCDPKAYFDKYGLKLVELTLEASRQLGRNPNAVGKSKNHWIQLHDKVINTVLRLTQGDEDKDIVIG